MKFAALFVVVLGICGTWSAPTQEKDDEKRSVIAGLSIAGLVLGGLAQLLKGINGPNNTKDTVLFGRSIRIHIPDDSKCAVVTDMASGYKSSKCADTSAAAASLAADELFTVLIKVGIMDADNLHHTPQDVTRPPVSCVDLVSSCDKKIKLGYCNPTSPYFHHTHHNCYRSCGGCQSMDAIMKAFQNQANQIAGTGGTDPAGR